MHVEDDHCSCAVAKRIVSCQLQVQVYGQGNADSGWVEVEQIGQELFPSGLGLFTPNLRVVCFFDASCAVIDCKVANHRRDAGDGIHTLPCSVGGRLAAGQGSSTPVIDVPPANASFSFYKTWVIVAGQQPWGSEQAPVSQPQGDGEEAKRHGAS